MTSIDARRDRLSSFLRERRALLQPEDVGLPERTRRRTQGLRRDDVALLAGLSTSWYTALEQGRDVRPSDRVLEEISRVLRLTAEERDYLFALAQNRPAPLHDEVLHAVSSSTRRMLKALKLPAYVLNARWDVLAWNRAAELCFADFAKMTTSNRNIMKILMTEATWRSDPEEYEIILQRVVAKLRLDYSRAPTDASIEELIAEMNEISPTFRRLWQTNLVSRTEQGIHTHHVPGIGPVTLENSGYMVEEDPALRLIIFSPVDEAGAEQLERMLKRAEDNPRHVGQMIEALY